MTKGAVLVETRLLSNLKEIIENHLLLLPEDWGFMIFGSIKNKSFFEQHFPGCPFVLLGKNEMDGKDYNEMLTGKWFWDKIPFDKILIFQHDSRILREGIEEFMQWDYVGSPWNFQMHGGNGGLSLRTKEAMMDIIEKSPAYNYPHDGNEDVWFCNLLLNHTKWKLASREVCEKFSVESIYKEGTFGYHAIDKWLTPIECSTILNQYSENGSLVVAKEVKKPEPVVLNIDEKYNELCLSESDIFQHLPTLKKYASEVSHVTELGFRYVTSTYAFLAGRPKSIVSYDIHYHENIEAAKVAAEKEGLKIKFVIGDVLKTLIDETDLLFIDTLHIYSQMKKELDLHASKVRKYIIFHDTETYAFSPEPSEWQTAEIMKNYKQDDKGIWPAIEEFLHENKNWKIKERFTNNNGLTVIEKIS